MRIKIIKAENGYYIIPLNEVTTTVRENEPFGFVAHTKDDLLKIILEKFLSRMDKWGEGAQ